MSTPVRKDLLAHRDAIGFVLELGRALHTYGYSAHQLEEVLGIVSRRLGIPGHQFFSTPTSIFAAFGPQDAQRTYLMRVEPGNVNLGKLARIDHIARRVLAGQLSPADGATEIAAVNAAPPIYSATATAAAYTLASASATRFLGGGLREIVVAAGIGLVVAIFALLVQRNRDVERIFEPFAAFVASFLATAAASLAGNVSLYTATLGGLIVLLPGFTLTTAVTELAARQLASGTARLSGAIITFLGIAFGVALGGRLAEEAFGTVATISPTALPDWTLFVALFVAPLSFVIILRAESRDAGWILASGILAFFGGRLGSLALGLELGVFVGAFVVGAASNLYSRFLRRPAPITLVPGILLLVPGSIGFRSLAALLDRQVTTGIETAFTMVLTAMALAGGMLAANILVPLPPETDRASV